VGFVGRAVVALLFPGQGSQFVGMGRDLCAAHPVARATFAEADNALGFPLSQLCADGPESDLTQTHNAQPAILTHSIAVLRCVDDALGGVACAAGHSLGEFSAWVAAGSMTFADGLRTVRRRGELMMRGGEERTGTMAAVLGLEDEVVEAICRDASTDGEVCVPANYNGPGQTVISGDSAAIDRAIASARGSGARRAIRLNVSGAFHSPLMKVAESGLAERLAQVQFADPRFPVVSNVTAQPIRDAATARRLLTAQLTAPVRWTESMQAIVAMGIRRFVEVGPGTILTGLLRRIERDVESRGIGTAADIAAFVAAP